MAPPHPPHPPDPPDGGLAEERTALSWNRSGLAVVVCVAVLLRHVWPLHGTDEELALGLIAGGRGRVGCGPGGSHVGGPPPQRGLAARCDLFRLATAGTLLLAVVGFLAAFAPS